MLFLCFFIYILCLHSAWVSNKLTGDIKIPVQFHIEEFISICESMGLAVKYFKESQWNHNGITMESCGPLAASPCVRLKT